MSRKDRLYMTLYTELLAVGQCFLNRLRGGVAQTRNKVSVVEHFVTNSTFGEIEIWPLSCYALFHLSLILYVHVKIISVFC